MLFSRRGLHAFTNITYFFSSLFTELDDWDTNAKNSEPLTTGHNGPRWFSYAWGDRHVGKDYLQSVINYVMMTISATCILTILPPSCNAVPLHLMVCTDSHHGQTDDQSSRFRQYYFPSSRTTLLPWGCIFFYLREPTPHSSTDNHQHEFPWFNYDWFCGRDKNLISSA